jgi:hypothetical protein
MSGGPDSAARLDAAIDALFDEHAPLVSVGDARDLELLATARLLHEALPRFHPRFGFEGRLARRLAEAGDGAGYPTRPVAAAQPGSVRQQASRADALVGELAGAVASPRRDGARRRGLLAGGAIASGLSLAIPIAGAALAVWRRSRASGGLP